MCQLGKLSFLGKVAAALAVVVSPLSVCATPFQQVTIGSNYAFDPSTNGAPTAPTGVSTTGYLDPTTQHAHPTWQNFGVSVKGGGSTGANNLRMFVESNAGFSYASSVISDSYTILGAPGVIPITVSLSGTATAEAILNTNNEYYGSAYFNVAIGTGVSASGRNAINYLDNDPQASGNLFGPGVVNINLSAVAIQNVTVGTPFELAYELSVTGSGAIRANALNTANINIIVPEGYTITSSLGYGVPEPTTIVLAGFGLAGIACVRRRRL